MENGGGMETDVHALAQWHRRMHRCCTRRSFPSPSRLHPLHHQVTKVPCTSIQAFVDFIRTPATWLELHMALHLPWAAQASLLRRTFCYRKPHASGSSGH